MRETDIISIEYLGRTQNKLLLKFLMNADKI